MMRELDQVATRQELGMYFAFVAVPTVQAQAIGLPAVAVGVKENTTPPALASIVMVMRPGFVAVLSQAQDAMLLVVAVAATPSHRPVFVAVTPPLLAMFSETVALMLSAKVKPSVTRARIV